MDDCEFHVLFGFLFVSIVVGPSPGFPGLRSACGYGLRRHGKLWIIRRDLPLVVNLVFFRAALWPIGRGSFGQQGVFLR